MLAPIALTCGDPSGIGPEIAVKAWRALGTEVPFFWIGDPGHLPSDAPASIISHPRQTLEATASGLPVLPHSFSAPASPGKPLNANAKGVVEVIARAVGLVKEGQASAITTCPISKQVLIEGARFAYPGHTEYLAALTGCRRVVMMLASDLLRVVPATIHIPLAKVPGALDPRELAETIRITYRALATDFGLPNPRIAVSGLNPHAGEGGLMGREEIELIAPVLDSLRREGIDIRGPLPADTMFHAAARAGYDAAVCMYHDQALIPIKTLDFDGGVNVTLGLPIVRTSPDHGTAFDIAGKGIANPNSLINALRMARDMAARRAE